jgi:hypothetical protein
MRNNSQPRSNTSRIVVQVSKKGENQAETKLIDFMINDMQNMYKRRQPS